MIARNITDIKRIIIHCSASNYGDVELFDKWHRERGWDCIGYNYVILNGYAKHSYQYNEEDDGRIEVGRPLEYVGAHCKYQNHDSIGICLVGDRLFSPKQLFESLPDLIGKLRKSYGPLTVHKHCDFTDKKTCPNINSGIIELIAEVA